MQDLTPKTPTPKGRRNRALCPARTSNFDDQNLCREANQRCGQRGRKQPAQAIFGHVAAGHPKQARGCPMAGDQLDEIGILADEHHVGSKARSAKYLCVFGITQSEIAQSDGLHATRLFQPNREARRELRIDPEDHATKRSRSVRRAAKCKQARMSSSWRSGKSARMVAASMSCASISSTSLTRMRIPRIQGLPPHCRGFQVMRESSGSDILCLRVRARARPCTAQFGGDLSRFDFSRRVPNAAISGLKPHHPPARQRRSIC